jgi:hypothetical protein
MTTLLGLSLQAGFLENILLLAVAGGLFVVARMVLGLRAEVNKLRSEFQRKQEEWSVKAAPVAAPAAASAPAVAPAAAPAAGPAPDPQDIPADIFAVIVSAVHYTLGDGHQIIALSAADSLAWSREGRRGIFGSHQLR